VQRPAWPAQQAQWDPTRLVFLDETGVTTHLTRLSGRAPQGERRYGRVPHGHWQSTTCVAALRQAGLTAPLVTAGPLNGERFVHYVQPFLGPTLAPGDRVIMDNLAAHKVKGVAEAIAARGARLLYLPPYSPEFNPIELLFAKLKGLLRQAAVRTVEALWPLIGELLDRFSAEECRNYFKHAGYCADEKKML